MTTLIFVGFSFLTRSEMIRSRRRRVEEKMHSKKNLLSEEKKMFSSTDEKSVDDPLSKTGKERGLNGLILGFILNI